MDTHERSQAKQARRISPRLRYLAAFFLGLPVGFLFRPFDTSYASLLSPIPPTPALLTLWNLWEIPVLLLWGLMLCRSILSFKADTNIRTPGRIILTILTLLLALLLLLYGIAPLEQLQWLHLYINIDILYACCNPFAVGLAVAFILSNIDRSTFSAGRAALLAILAWAGTATLFFSVVEAYINLVSPLCFHFTCQAGMIPNLAPVWMSVGLLIAATGGYFGGWLVYALLSRPAEID